ncbi:KamA family radical SAM protein [Candidatus Neptunochlamydia vexilliferae]|uniref:L-lysine 2,3-aminomutase n=1 Tax=Candidatus Neptunichlamydia vexilliferae TaxID=1651774 RepID=A0ABS0AX61_9BACT|nr:KamA family radical SAM protein [Candidatus Neptunochlamydia vexilliferae]MBF5058724.1 L-lysine 2,3-aminomutase [Candidatus Neptunochlamydia vexilliferae]
MSNWRALQRENFTQIDKLADFLELAPEKRETLLKAPPFPLNFPKRLAEKVTKNSLSDPILRQFLPIVEETKETAGFSSDPVCDASFQKTPHLLQKYGGRALLITTSACVMNCRFCFRQNYPYEGGPKTFEKELEMLQSDPSIHEVILSGGDPLSLSDEKLGELIRALETIPHLKLLRFHTRFPIGIPERITEELVSLLKETRLQPIFVLHTNHTNELDGEVFAALKNLGAPLLSQTVLLHGVNDDVIALKELFLKLAAHGILPYYLHQLDRVKQAHHFEVPIEKGKELIAALRKELPGYAVPTYVQEVAHEPHKTPL